MRITPSLDPATRKMQPMRTSLSAPHSAIALAGGPCFSRRSRGSPSQSCRGPARTEAFLSLATKAAPTAWAATMHHQPPEHSLSLMSQRAPHPPFPPDFSLRTKRPLSSCFFERGIRITILLLSQPFLPPLSRCQLNSNDWWGQYFEILRYGGQEGRGKETQWTRKGGWQCWSTRDIRTCQGW